MTKRLYAVSLKKPVFFTELLAPIQHPFIGILDPVIKKGVAFL